MTGRTRLLAVEPLEARDTPAVLYVAPSGADANPGSATAPLLTLQAAADRVAPGDTVLVRAGAYQGFNLTTDGTAAARITFRADPAAPKGAVVVDRPNPWNGLDGINLEGASYVTIDGFTVTGQPRAGIRSVTNEFVVIRNNVADANTRWGIFTGFSADLTVEYNQASRSAVEHGIYVSNSADRPIVRGNTAFENRGCGIHMNADASQGGDGVISDAVIEGNILRANGAGGGAAINLDGVQDSDVRNNLILDARATGIALFRQEGAAGSANNRVVNNTVVVDYAASPAAGRWAVSISGGSTGTVLRNNVLFSTHSFRGAVAVAADSLAGLASDYNAVEDRFSADGGNTALDLAGWQAATGQDRNSVRLADVAALNGLFVDRPGGDYHLRPGSPAVDRGTPLGAPAADFEGQARPAGAGYDIGADEYVATPPPNAPPTVSAVPDRTVPAGGSTGAVPFTVGDTETSAGALAVTASSSDPTLLPPGGIVLGGAGASRTVTLTPAAGRSGTAAVTLTVADAGGATASVTFTLTVTPPPVGQPYAAGTDAGPVATVALFNPDGSARLRVRPFGDAYTGGVRVAAGDVTGDGVPDVVVGSNGGMYSQAVVVDGATGAVRPEQLLPRGWSYGGVAVAVGDVTGDGVADIALGTDDGGPRARVIRGGDFALLADFVAGPAAGFWGQTQVALGDLNADGAADLVVAGYYSTGTTVYGFTGTSLRPGTAPSPVFAPFNPGAVGAGKGVFLAVGDVDGDGDGDLVLGAGAWGNGRVVAYSGRALVQANARVVLADFAPAGVASTTGVRVAVRDVNADGRGDILTASGEVLTAFAGGNLPAVGIRPSVLRATDPYPDLPGGVWVG
ncbi:right-handed parallel beta-helix repeat-containing protein [bacterium]|nr:right-handed parallel beta-helix repeat-containing protein [bacterium]